MSQNSGWHNVEETLPPEDVVILLWDKYAGFLIGGYTAKDVNAFWKLENSRITYLENVLHWYKLPDPPQDEKAKWGK